MMTIEVDRAVDVYSASVGMPSVQNVTQCEIRFRTANFDAGEMFMYKRQTYVGRE